MAREVTSRRDALYMNLTVPILFRCPISMDVMLSPVSLSTGVTYDRTSIQTWLSQGHNTCPATMQVLPSTDYTPNLTLRRLIHHYFNQQSLPAADVISPASPRNECLGAIRNLAGATACTSAIVSLNKIFDFVKFSEVNRRFVANSDDAVAGIVDSLLRFEEIEILERIVSILELILSGNDVKLKQHLHSKAFSTGTDNFSSKFVRIMKKGRLISRISLAKIIESIAATDFESKSSMANSEGLQFELYRLIAGESETKAMEAGLSGLIAVAATSKTAKRNLLRFGIVRTIGRILSDQESSDQHRRRVDEKAMEMLALISTCTDGREAIIHDENCIKGVVNKIIKCSSVATEHGITIIWSLCSLARDQTAQDVVKEVNGLTKVLLVMQSNCGAEAREMCGDLIKVLRIKNSKSCLASYETKTTHIMPF